MKRNASKEKTWKSEKWKIKQKNSKNTKKEIKERKKTEKRDLRGCGTPETAQRIVFVQEMLDEIVQQLRPKKSDVELKKDKQHKEINS